MSSVTWSVITLSLILIGLLALRTSPPQPASWPSQSRKLNEDSADCVRGGDLAQSDVEGGGGGASETEIVHWDSFLREIVSRSGR